LRVPPTREFRTLSAALTAIIRTLYRLIVNVIESNFHRVA
jgi:hypothetical protein